MPYIKKERRKLYDSLIQKLSEKVAKTNIDDCTSFCGDWNYITTKLIRETFKSGGIHPRYTDLNEVIGMLECCKLEVYRRMVASYEDEKIKENGDV